jgi:hypothetical protein
MSGNYLFDFKDKFYEITKFPEAYTGYDGKKVWE